MFTKLEWPPQGDYRVPCQDDERGLYEESSKIWRRFSPWKMILGRPDCPRFYPGLCPGQRCKCTRYPQHSSISRAARLRVLTANWTWMPWAVFWTLFCWKKWGNCLWKMTMFWGAGRLAAWHLAGVICYTIILLYYNSFCYYTFVLLYYHTIILLYFLLLYHYTIVLLYRWIHNTNDGVYTQTWCLADRHGAPCRPWSLKKVNYVFKIVTWKWWIIYINRCIL